MSSIARKSPKLPKTAFFISRSQGVTFCPTCSVSITLCPSVSGTISAFPSFILCFASILSIPSNSTQFGPTVDPLSIGRYWPVRKTKSCLAFLNLFFELLHTVQESHHCMIKLVVPEKPQPPRTVQRQLLPKERELVWVWHQDRRSEVVPNPTNLSHHVLSVFHWEQ